MPHATGTTEIEPQICDLARLTRIASRSAETMAADLPERDAEALVDFLDTISNLASQLRKDYYASLSHQKAA